MPAYILSKIAVSVCNESGLWCVHLKASLRQHTAHCTL